MPLHRLTKNSDSYPAGWVLEWDASAFTLTSPDGEVALELPTQEAHWWIGLPELYGMVSKVCVEPPVEMWFQGLPSHTFRRQPEAVRDVRRLVESAFGSDTKYRCTSRISARNWAIGGSAGAVIGGGLFSLYCWWASWAPDPPRWVWCIGPLIYLLLAVCMAAVPAGALLGFSGLRLLRRIRRAERGLTGSDGRLRM